MDADRRRIAPCSPTEDDPNALMTEELRKARVDDRCAAELERRPRERRMLSHVWALPRHARSSRTRVSELFVALRFDLPILPASDGRSERGPTMSPSELPELLLKIPGHPQSRPLERKLTLFVGWSQEPDTRRCCERCYDAGGERNLTDGTEPTERPDDEGAKSFEAREVDAQGAREPEDLFPSVSRFEFVASSELADACVHRGGGPAVSEKVADCRRDLAVLRIRPGR